MAGAAVASPGSTRRVRVSTPDGCAGPPDGAIDGFDIAFVVVQFGHTCA